MERGAVAVLEKQNYFDMYYDVDMSKLTDVRRIDY